MVTKNGIYHDLNETIYFYRLLNYKFYFSSKVYRDKFIARYPNFIKEESYKFKERFGFNLKNYDLFLFRLYSIIEKRGFLVEEYSEEEKIITYDILPILDIILDKE